MSSVWKLFEWCWWTDWINISREDEVQGRKTENVHWLHNAHVYIKTQRLNEAKKLGLDCNCILIRFNDEQSSKMILCYRMFELVSK